MSILLWVGVIFLAIQMIRVLIVLGLVIWVGITDPETARRTHLDLNFGPGTADHLMGPRKENNSEQDG